MRQSAGKKELSMRILKPSLIGLTTAAMLSNPLMFINVAKADVPPFLFDTHKTRLPHADCIRDARRTAREVGFTDVKDLDFAVLANVGNSAVLIDRKSTRLNSSHANIS